MVVVALLLGAGCNKRPKGVLSDDEMVGLIADMQIAEVYMQQHNSGYYNDSIRDSAVQWALDKHGLSKADFDSTMTWYGRNIDDYLNLFGKVDAELAKRQNRAIGETEKNLVSTDLWPYSRHILISENAPSNGLAFSLPLNDIPKGERITWKMRLKGLSSGNVLLGVDYDNGMSSYTYQTQNGNSKIDLTLQTDTAYNVKRVFGYMRTKEDHSLPIWIDSIALQQLPLDSTEYYRIHSQRKYSGFHKRVKVSEKKDTIEEDSKIAAILEDTEGNQISVKPADKRKRLLRNSNVNNNRTLKILPQEELKAVPAKELVPLKK